MNAPGVFVAKSLRVATSYPMAVSMGALTASDQVRILLFMKRVPGGNVIATDVTSPVRAMLHYSVLLDRHLWHRGSNQSLFVPGDLSCIHAVFCATGANFAHRV